MVQQIVDINDSGLASKNKINSNFNELYQANIDINQAVLDALANYTPTSGLASVALSGSAADLTTGTLSDSRLSSNVALKNANNVFSGGNTFQATQIFESSVCIGLGGTGPRIRNNGQLFRFNNNADTLRAGIEVGDVASSGSITAASDLDSNHTFGRVRLGSVVSDLAYFSHFDHYNNNTYALRQDSSGFTCVNGGVNGVEIRTNNATAVRIPNNGLAEFAGNIQLGGPTGVRLNNNTGTLDVRNSGNTGPANINVSGVFVANSTYVSFGDSLGVHSSVGLARTATGDLRLRNGSIVLSVSDTLASVTGPLTVSGKISATGDYHDFAGLLVAPAGQTNVLAGTPGRLQIAGSNSELRIYDRDAATSSENFVIYANADTFRINRLSVDRLILDANGKASFGGTVQVGGGSANVLRWNNSVGLEVRDSTNSVYGNFRSGNVQVTNVSGGSLAVPGNSRVGLMTQMGAYLAGAITGRTYSSNLSHGDIIVSASLNITTGQNDYSGLTDDLVVRGNTGNVEINRGNLNLASAKSINMSTGANTFSTFMGGPGNYEGYQHFQTNGQTNFWVYSGGTISRSTIQLLGDDVTIRAFDTAISYLRMYGTGKSECDLAGGSNVRLITGGATRLTIGSTGLVTVSNSLGVGAAPTTHRLFLASTTSGSSLSYETVLVSVKGNADTSAHARFIRTGISEWYLNHNSAGSLELALSVNIANPDFSFANGGLFVANSQVKLGNTSGVRLKNSGSRLFVRNENDTDYAEVRALRAMVHTGVHFLDQTTGTEHWFQYKIGGDARLYVRDAINSRMHVTYTAGVDAVAASTQFHSNVTADGYITSAFQTLSADPTTLDISSGMSRLVYNSNLNELRHWVNVGGTLRKSAAYT